jgi:hypothetical protein
MRSGKPAAAALAEENAVRAVELDFARAKDMARWAYSAACGR